jgi:isocitrate dehydrogenase
LDLFARFARGLAGTRSLAVTVSAEGGVMRCEHPAGIGQPVDPAAVALAAGWFLLAIRQTKAAQTLHNAVLLTLEDGVHTEALDLLNPYSTRVLPEGMIEAIAARLGQAPRRLPAADYGAFRARSAAFLKAVSVKGPNAG